MKPSTGRTVAIIAAIVALLGALIAVNQMNDRANPAAPPGLEHDHDGDGKPDH
jgi:hypothetical protein